MYVYERKYIGRLCFWIFCQLDWILVYHRRLMSATIKCQGEDDGDDDDGDDDDGVDCIHHPLAFIGAFCGGRCHQNALGSSMVTKIKIEMSARVAKNVK